MQSTELWKPVVGYEGYYEVSDYGRVKSLERIIVTRTGDNRIIRGRVLRPGANHEGRLMVALCRYGRCKTQRVHRLVIEAFVGPAPTGMECCHFDGDPSNNHLSNLRWDTQSENRLDSVRHGTHPETRKTACPKGHPLAEPNLNKGGLRRGTRDCLACGRARQHARHTGTQFTQELADAYYERLLHAA